MSNIYKAPESNLVNERLLSDEYGSIEKAIQGDYEFSISSVLSEAWQKTKGSKWQVQLAFFYYFLVAIAVMVVLSILMSIFMAAVQGPEVMVLTQVVMQVGMNLVVLPVMMGILVMGIRRSVDAPINAGMVFAYFSRTIQLFATLVLVYIMVAIGLVLFILPGIYLMIAYYMAMPLVVEKNMSPWQAMEVSRKAITHRWFSVFFLFLILFVVIVISALPLGLGMIWTLPWGVIAFGILYRNIFGVEADTLA